MASREEIEAALAAAPAPEWETPRDLNRISFEALFGAGDGARTLRSTGHVRLYGANVRNHSARLDATAEVLAQLQRLVTAMGAARRGIRSSQGPLPGELITLTQLKIAAAPAPGSLVFELVPESLPETELLDEGSGVAIFDQAQRQFVDECFEDALGLVTAAHSIGLDADDQAEPETADDQPEPDALFRLVVSELREAPEPPEIVARLMVVRGDDDADLPLAARSAAEPPTLAGLASPVETPAALAFVERVREGGPRLASAVRTFARAIESADFDVDLEWREPNQATRRAKFTRQDAGLVRHLVVSRELEVELQNLTGRLTTLSETRAWQLTVGQDEAPVTIDASKLELSVQRAFRLHDSVTIRVRAIQSTLPGGGITTRFEAVSVTSAEPRADA